MREVIEAPAIAFEGLRTIDESLGDSRRYVEVPDPTGLCLAGIPSSRILVGGVKTSPPEGYTFAVFMDRRLIISDWDWIASDHALPIAPIYWVTRFNRKIWPRD